MRNFIVIYLTLFLVSCETPNNYRLSEGPLWKREGGILNPWAW